MDVKTECEITGQRINIIECGSENCGFIDIFEKSEKQYYEYCICYGGYIDFAYLVRDTGLSLGSIQVQYNIANNSETEESLRNNYFKGKTFACYYNKFNTENVHIKYDTYLIVYILIVIGGSLIFGQCIAIAYLCYTKGLYWNEPNPRRI
jgi:hypothetical protein